MQRTHIIGIDPGIVHTGVVSIDFNPVAKTILLDHEVVQGTDARATATWIRGLRTSRPDHVFIEGYRPRSNLGHDKDMVNAVAHMKAATHGTVLDNTGIKKVVRPAVLQALGVWQFSTPTHHDDLRSAARIAVLGMLKLPELNELLADVVRDHLDGKGWTVA